MAKFGKKGIAWAAVVCLASVMCASGTASAAEYLEPFTNEFGLETVRITGDEGSPIFGAKAAWPNWQFVSRNRYVTDSAWSVDERYLIIGSADKDGHRSFKALLDGATYEPLRVLGGGLNPNYRWSADPAEPHALYAILPGADRIVKYADIGTSDAKTDIPLPFTTIGKPLTKTGFARAGGAVYLALLGTQDLSGKNPGDIYLHIVKMEGDRVSPVAMRKINEPECGYVAEICATPNPNTFHFSPDGRYVFVKYTSEEATTANGWRLFDIDIAKGTVSPHEVPQLAFANSKSFANGFFNVNWGHIAFVPSRDRERTYLVGTIYNFWHGETVEGVWTVNRNNKIGKAMAFDPARNMFMSLTDPETAEGMLAESGFLHASATNTASPGYVFVSYLTDAGQKYKGEIIAINVEAPARNRGTMEVVRHGSATSGGCYDCQVFLNISPSGRKLVYSTNQGDTSNPIRAYVTSLPDVIRHPGPPSPDDFRKTQKPPPPPPPKSDLKVLSVKEKAVGSDTVQFTVRVVNAGPDKSFQSTMKIAFPANRNLSVVSMSDNCKAVDGLVLSCDLWTIRPGASKPVTVTVREASCNRAGYAVLVTLGNIGTDTDASNDRVAYTTKAKSGACVSGEPAGKRGGAVP